MNADKQSHNIVCLDNGLQHGEYYLGPELPLVSPSPIRTIKEHLAKNVATSDFVSMKILKFTSLHGDCTEDNQGKVLLHNEHSVLSILQDVPGVICHHGLFKELHRIILVLSCVYKHDHDEDKKYQDFINLQHYIIQKKRLCEMDALRLFYRIATTVLAIHEKNIVHRDIKLGNVVLNTRTQEIIITNFGLSKHLVREDDLLTDQRGSLAYVSPDVLSGEPYLGKPCDVWSLGILLYTMLYGQFPFYDENPHELFKKIRNASFTLPRNIDVSADTQIVLSQLIESDPKKRLTVSDTLDAIQSILFRLSLNLQLEQMQIVPEIDVSNSVECVVPDNDRLFSTTSNSNVNIIEMSAPRLSLKTLINPEMQSIFYLQSSPHSISPGNVSPRLAFFPDTQRDNLLASVTNESGLSQSLPTSSINWNCESDNTPTLSLPVYFNLVPTNTVPSPTSSTLPTPPFSGQMYLQPQFVYHRHSFSTDTPYSHHQQQQHCIPHGRRSVGSMLGNGTRTQRRNSQQHNADPHGMLSVNDHQQRRRRRSHEPRDTEREILQGLQAAANDTFRRISN